MTDNTQTEKVHAIARSKNIPVSTKHCIEISRCLRYKDTSYAKRFLEDVIGMKRAVPFRKFNKDVGHKPGMAAGRFPQKAATEFLKLVKSVESNAQNKGMGTSGLKIIKVFANKASIPMTGGRRSHATKRTNLELEVKERKMVKKVINDKMIEKKVESGKEKIVVKKVEKKTENKVEEKKEKTKIEKKVSDVKEKVKIEEVKTDEKVEIKIKKENQENAVQETSSLVNNEGAPLQ